MNRPGAPLVTPGSGGRGQPAGESRRVRNRARAGRHCFQPRQTVPLISRARGPDFTNIGGKSSLSSRVHYRLSVTPSVSEEKEADASGSHTCGGRVPACSALDRGPRPRSSPTQPPHHEELRNVFLAPERAEHASEVARGGDGGAKSAADRLPDGCAAEVLVTAGAFGEGDDLHLAVRRLSSSTTGSISKSVRSSSGSRLSALRALIRASASSSRCRFPGRVDGVRSTPSVISSEPSMTRGEGSDEDVDRALLLERGQDRVGIETRLRARP